jgi:hypothetical protein
LEEAGGVLKELGTYFGGRVQTKIFSPVASLKQVAKEKMWAVCLGA